MSKTVAPASTSERQLQLRLLDFVRSPEGTIVVYALVAIVATVAAYFYLFTQFAPYDDEGTVLVTLKAFVAGETLYKDVYTPFGPFYYELFGSLFSLSGHAVTTDSSRSIVMVIWVGSSLFFGLAVQRLTGCVALGVTAMLVAFTVVFILSQEPMHAQVLAVALLATFTLVVSRVDTRRVVLAGGVCGALLAALVLTKINLGIYSVAAICLATVLAVDSLYRHQWVRWPVIFGFLVMPFVVTRSDLSNELVRNLVLLEGLAAVSIIAAARSLRFGEEVDAACTKRWLRAAIVGFILAFTAILLTIFATGSSPADVYDGVVTQALRIRTVNPAPIGITTASLDWGIAAISAAAFVSWMRLRGEGGSRLWSGVLRASSGLAIWFSITQMAPLSLGPAPGNPDALAAMLAWTAVIPPVGAVESTQKRFVRVLLPALAIAEVLQVYPVAGSQMRIAAVTFVVVGGICLGDAFNELRAWSAARGAMSLKRFGAFAGVAICALGAKFALDGMVQPAIARIIVYNEEKALPFPGVTALHLPTAEAEAYERTVEDLRRYRCSTFIGYANVDSLYLWSRIDPPRPSAPSAWMLALDEAEQNRILRQMRATPRPCAVRNEGVAGGWLAGRPRPETPLVDYIFNAFEVVDEAGPFEFMLPKEKRG